MGEHVNYLYNKLLKLLGLLWRIHKNFDIKSKLLITPMCSHVLITAVSYGGFHLDSSPGYANSSPN